MDALSPIETETAITDDKDEIAKIFSDTDNQSQTESKLGDEQQKDMILSLTEIKGDSGSVKIHANENVCCAVIKLNAPPAPVISHFAADAGFEPVACRAYRSQAKEKAESLAYPTSRLLPYNGNFDVGSKPVPNLQLSGNGNLSIGIN